MPGSLLTRAVDTALDKSLVLGYTKLALPLRRRWWPADPPPGVLADCDVVVTGGSSGLGRATASGLATLGARVHLVGRTHARLEEAATAVRETVPEADVVLRECDISDLDQARDLAAALGEMSRLHALVHCAGVMPPERTETPQRHEQAFATHVLGPHVLTWSLREQLSAVPGSRVVTVSSGGMYGQPLTSEVVDDVEYERGDYRGLTAYARTKRMQVVMTELAARRLGPAFAVHSMHPGWAATAGVTDSLPGFGKVMGPALRSAEDGADTIVWLAAAPAAAYRTGLFWHDRRPRAIHYLPWQKDDPAARDRLWDVVSDATGQSRD